MAMGELELRLEAVERYTKSARQAEIADYWARLSGKSASLLKYEDVAARLHLRQQIPLGHQMVALHRIVGSVGRYREFTQGFLPRRMVLQDRWVAVDVTMNSLAGLPPVELYKVGEAYFVVDGNHRISVARANGNKDIEAVVTEWEMRLPFTLEDFTGDKWAAKAAYSDFVAETKLDQVRPNAKLELSDGAHYQTLLQHIAVHRYLANKAQHGWAWEDGARVMSWSEAVASWYDTVYMPLVEAIHTHQLPHRFAKRTESDLYIAITHYREQVADHYALAPLSADSAARIFAANHSDRALDRLFLTLRQRVVAKLPRYWSQAKIPAGITAEEFGALRLRREAGELSLGEAGRHATHEPCFLPDGAFSVQFSG